MATPNIDVNDLVEKMDFISLVDMETYVPIDKMLLVDYEGAAKDLCIFLVQGNFKHIIYEAGGKMDTRGKEQALIMAKWQATKRLTTDEGLKGLIEKGILYILEDAQKTGWHNALEYDNIAELLASMLEGKEGKDEAYDWKFIIEQLMPAAERAEIAPKDIWAASRSIKKIRGIVPAARELLDKQSRDEIDPKEAEATLKGWIAKTVDENVTYEGLREELDEWRGKSVRRGVPLIGYKIMMPEGYFMLAIPTETDRDVAIIEQALRNRVDIRLTGFDWLQGQVLGQTKSHRLAREHEQELVDEMRLEMQREVNDGRLAVE